MATKKAATHGVQQETPTKLLLRDATSSPSDVAQTDEGILQLQTPDITWNPSSDFDLCRHCTKLDLPTLFTTKCLKTKSIGFLDLFSTQNCPFCAIIWRSIHIHWGSANPSEDRDIRPELFVQRPVWGYRKPRYLEGEDFMFRISLAITQTPPALPLWRPTWPNASPHAYKITEMELLPKAEFRRLIKPYLDLDLLRHILHHCDSEGHLITVPRYANLFSAGFRLVDVLEARLVQRWKPCKYIALSYVWGEATLATLRTTKLNLRQLEKRGALRDSMKTVGKRLPQTIVDAMELCRRMGYSYLWVDSLCIIQDDADEKARLIHGMNHVYESASLTIMAISGTNADAGLPGVQVRADLPYEDIYTMRSDVELLAISLTRMSLKNQIRASFWNTRGWTYQEEALSQRRLYFTPDEVFFQCDCGCHFAEGQGYTFDPLYDFNERPADPKYDRNAVSSHYEDTEATLPWNTLDGNVSLPYWPHSPSAGVRLYATAVSSYCGRHFTNPTDVLNAFTGIYNRLVFPVPISPKDDVVCDPGILATQGIPIHIFPWAVLWRVSRPCTTKVRLRDLGPDRPLSSWSWASWVSPIDFVLGHGYIHSPNMDHPVHYFVNEWCLTFSVKDTTTSIRHTTAAHATINYHEGTLRKIGTKPPLSIRGTTPGTVEFMAPCIPLSAGFKVIPDRSTPSIGSWVFKFDFGNSYGYVRTDSPVEGLEGIELALVLDDGCYEALCIKTVGGISKKVGVATLSVAKGAQTYSWVKLGLQWKHICLQ